MSEATILIADDHELVRRGLVSIITRSHPEWKVVAEVANGADAIKEGGLLKPDVAILDLSMPEKSGLEAAQSLRESVPGIRIMILTMYASAIASVCYSARGVRFISRLLSRSCLWFTCRYAWRQIPPVPGPQSLDTSKFAFNPLLARAELLKRLLKTRPQPDEYDHARAWTVPKSSGSSG